MTPDHTTPRGTSAHRRPGAGRSAPDDPDWTRIERLLDRLDARIGEPGGVPGEVVLRRGRRSLADAA